MLEVWIREELLMGSQNIVYGLESGGNVRFPDLEFCLHIGIGELNFVVINELGKQISENFVVESKTIRLDLFWAELGSNGSDLVSDNIE